MEFREQFVAFISDSVSFRMSSTQGSAGIKAFMAAKISQIMNDNENSNSPKSPSSPALSDKVPKVDDASIQCENVAMFQCHLCPYKSSHRGSLKSHYAVHSDERPFACDMCSYEAKRHYDLKKHQILRHGKKDLVSRKNQAVSRTGRKRLLTSVSSNSSEDSDTPPPSSSAKLEGSPKDNGVISFLLQQNSSLTTDRSLAICQASSSTSNCAKEVGVESRKSWSCSHCDILFFDSALYFLHMGMHNSTDPWSCNICHWKFTDVYSFTSHFINSHQS